MRFEQKPRGRLFGAGRVFSFVLMLGFFMAVLYLLFFRHGFLQSNLLLFAEAIIALVLVNVVFPRALEKMRENELSEGMKKGAHLFGEKFSQALGWVTLSITYVIGVGFVWLISRIFRKRFIEIKAVKKQSYWIEKKEMGNEEEMF